MDRPLIELSVVVDDQSIRIVVAGELDDWGGALLTRLLEGCDRTSTVIDASGVTFCDAGGLGHLVSAAGSGVRVDVRSAGDAVLTVAELVGVPLDRLLPQSAPEDA